LIGSRPRLSEGRNFSLEPVAVDEALKIAAGVGKRESRGSCKMVAGIKERRGTIDRRAEFVTASEHGAGGSGGSGQIRIG
jgi:hypothetical protein